MWRSSAWPEGAEGLRAPAEQLQLPEAGAGGAASRDPLAPCGSGGVWFATGGGLPGGGVTSFFLLGKGEPPLKKSSNQKPRSGNASFCLSLFWG